MTQTEVVIKKCQVVQVSAKLRREWWMGVLKLTPLIVHPKAFKPFLIEQVYALELKFDQGDYIAAIRLISPNAIMSLGEFANRSS